MNNVTNLMVLFVALTASLFVSGASLAQDTSREQELLAFLADPNHEDWKQSEDEIIKIWSQSGSIALDLLLDRGRDALDAEDYQVAIEHFTAAIDHAPEFAEAWNMRATAFFLIEEYGLSIEDIGQTLALNPNQFGAMNGLGVILEELGDRKNALKAYEAAFEINPHRENVKEAIDRLDVEVNGRAI